VHGNATATANNIAAHESLFRLGIAGDLFTGTIVIFVALALYRLFKGVDQNLAVLMVILGGVLPSAIYFFNRGCAAGRLVGEFARKNQIAGRPAGVVRLSSRLAGLGVRGSACAVRRDARWRSSGVAGVTRRFGRDAA